MLVNANALHIPLKDKSVQMCVTSPPYWGLRDYGTAKWVGGDSECKHQVGRFQYPASNKQKSNTASAGHQAKDKCPHCGAIRIDKQLGLEQTPEEYVENMVAVFREVWRVLRDDGTLWLNLGDSYASSAACGRRSEIGLGNCDNRINRLSGILKEKDLVGIPWRVAFALQADGADTRAVRAIQRAREEIYKTYDYGEIIPDKIINVLDSLEKEYIEAKGNSWYLRNDIIWHKPNPMPESVTDRCTKSHEYIFLLSKNKKYYYDNEAIKEPGKKASVDRMNRGVSNNHKNVNGAPGQTPHSMNKPRQKVPSNWDTRQGAHGSFHREGRSPDAEYTATYSLTRNKRTVWAITTKPYSGAHYATFPPELPEICIKAGTSEKGKCPECGKAWIRTLSPATGGAIGESWHDHSADEIKGNAKVKSSKGYQPGKTLGWKPTCDHKHEPIPCIVFDPFIGSGTTCMVARDLGRNSVGLDLSLDYLIDDAKKRLEIDKLEYWISGGKEVEENYTELPMFLILEEGE